MACSNEYFWILQHNLGVLKRHGGFAKLLVDVTTELEALKPRLVFPSNMPPLTTNIIGRRLGLHRPKAALVSRMFRAFVADSMRDIERTIKVNCVVAGHRHTLICTNHGVFAIDSNRHGRSVSNNLNMVSASADTGAGVMCDTQGQLFATACRGCAQDVHPVHWDGTPPPCGGFRSASLKTQGGDEFIAIASDGGLYKLDSLWAVRTTTRLLEGVTVAGVAVGHAHAIACVWSGAVYTWGLSEDGQLGHGGDDADDSYLEDQPRLVEALQHVLVVQVAAGEAHSAAVTKDETLYTWGMGTDGQLGHGDLESSPLPRIVESMSDKRVTGVAAGWVHTLVLANGDVYACGCGEGGAMGHSNKIEEIQTMDPHLRRMSGLTGKRITSLSAGYDHSVVASSNEVFICGGADDHDRQREFLTPTPLHLAAMVEC